MKNFLRFGPAVTACFTLVLGLLLSLSEEPVFTWGGPIIAILSALQLALFSYHLHSPEDIAAHASDA